MFKREWFLKQSVQDSTPLLLILDGHFSHLDINMLFTAAKSKIIVLCLPAHATMVCQPNDQMVNKHFKALLDNGLKSMVSNQILIEPFDIAMLCEKSLADSTMRKAITSSWQMVGIFPFDETRIIKKLKNFKSKEQEGKEKEILEKVIILIEEKYAIQKTEQTKKEKQKREAEKSILFQTTTTRILNSSSSLARRRISNEWQECKTLKKKELISRITTMLGFSNDDVTKKYNS
jgi:hypothetical protein